RAPASADDERRLAVALNQLLVYGEALPDDLWYREDRVPDLTESDKTSLKATCARSLLLFSCGSACVLGLRRADKSSAARPQLPGVVRAGLSFAIGRRSRAPRRGGGVQVRARRVRRRRAGRAGSRVGSGRLVSPTTSWWCADWGCGGRKVYGREGATP